MDIMMAIGTYLFSLDTAAYQEFTRSTDYRWKSQERINNIDALQFTGEGTDSITLSGVIYPHYKGGTTQLNDMRDMAATGKPLVLVDGLGFTYGLWIIEKVEETVDAFFGHGLPRKQKFTMQIRKYASLDGVLFQGLIASFQGVQV